MIINISIYMPYGVLWTKDHNFIMDGYVYTPLLDKSYSIDNDTHKKLSDAFIDNTDTVLSSNSLDYHLLLQTAALERTIGTENASMIKSINELFEISINKLKPYMVLTEQYTYNTIPYGFMLPSTVRLYSVGKSVILTINTDDVKIIDVLKKVQRKLKFAHGVVSILDIENNSIVRDKYNESLAKDRNYHIFDNRFVTRYPYEVNTTAVSET